MNGKHGSEVSLEVRCAIVTCRILFNCTYDAIERKTGVNKETARKIMVRATNRAGCEDFHELLACVGDMERTGRPPRVANGTKLSKDIRNAILNNPTLHPQIAVLDKENITIPGMLSAKRPARSIIERVQHEHDHRNDKEESIEDIVRVNQPTKPLLNHDHKGKRKTFCDQALERIDNGDIYICSDESWHEIGGMPSGKKRKISIPKGTDPHQHAAPEPAVQFSIMQWGSMTTKGEMGPQIVLATETKEEKLLHEGMLKERNKNAKKKTDEQRRQAEIIGTPDFKLLEEANAEVKLHNTRLQEAGNKGLKGTKKPFTAERFFRYPDIEQRGKRGGIDAFIYREKVLLPLLYPFYEKVQRENPDVNVWLIEDNAPSHTLAAKQCQEDRERRGIKKVEWPPNSPDLHAIEDLWSPEKNQLAPEWLKIKGAGKEARSKAIEFIEKAWTSSQMKAAAEQACADWPSKLRHCSAQNGDNRFRG